MGNLYKPGDIVLVKNSLINTEDRFLILGWYGNWYICAEFLYAAPVNELSITVGDSFVSLAEIVAFPEKSINEKIERISEAEIGDVMHSIRQIFGLASEESPDANAMKENCNSLADENEALKSRIDIVTEKLNDMSDRNHALIEEVNELKARNETLIHDNSNLLEKVNDLENNIRELSGVIDPEEVEELHIADLKTEIAVLNKVIDTLLDRIGKENGKKQ